VTLPDHSRLGPYEIIGLLGAGGMGEVYRARDPRIGREVAIKTLPARFGSDPEFLRRFEQEARAAGLLNHPNVLVVYDVGSDNGVHYVVSELLEGETLSARLQQGSIPRRKAVAYALDALGGLAAAHEKGIVHRDLKPANLFLTRDDRLKILDFGLAKLTVAAPASDETQTVGPLTSPGVVMGSMGYMSPEQVRGKAVDHRSDIFSMGVVIYEMLNGRAAFHGDSAVECMNAVLKEDPPPLEGMPALDSVLRHCLEKKAELRFQSARDLAFALEAAGNSVSAITPAIPAASRSRRVNLRRFAWPAALIAAAALAWLVGRGGGARSVPEFHRLGLYHEPTYGARVRHRFTADAKTIVVSNDQGVFLTSTENPGARSLNLPGYRLLAVSSTGELALRNDGRTAFTVPLSGGAPRAIAENILEADWAPDGKSLAVIRQASGVSTLEYPVDHVLYRTLNSLANLRVSPTGDSVAFVEHDAERRTIMLVTAGGERRTLSAGWNFASGLAWKPDGSEVWLGATRAGYDYPLWAVPLSGKPRVVERLPGRIFIDDISKEGRALLYLGFTRAGMSFRGPGDAAERDLSWLDFSIVSAITADGRSVLFGEQGAAAGDRPLVYLRDTTGAPAVRLGEGTALSLSPDGTTVLTRAPQEEKFALVPTGAGQSRVVNGPGRLFDAAVILPDGRILCWAQASGQGARLLVQEANGGWKPLSNEFGDTRTTFQTALSPGGDRVAVLRAARLELFTPATNTLTPVAGWTAGDQIAGWTADGKSLYAGRGSAGSLDIYRFDLDTHTATPWKHLGPNGKQPQIVRVTPDGGAYAYTYVVSNLDAFVVDGLK
jgi:Tol biopolymer transport system component